jgi:hypothetical protein
MEIGRTVKLHPHPIFQALSISNFYKVALYAPFSQKRLSTKRTLRHYFYSVPKKASGDV